MGAAVPGVSLCTGDGISVAGSNIPDAAKTEEADGEVRKGSKTAAEAPATQVAIEAAKAAALDVARVFNLAEEEVESWEDEVDDIPNQEHVFSSDLTDEERAALQEEMIQYQDDIVDQSYRLAMEFSRHLHHNADTFESPREMHWQLKNPPRAKDGANVTILSGVKPAQVEIWRLKGMEMILKAEIGVVILAAGDSRERGENMPAPLQEAFDPQLGRPPSAPLVDVGLLSHKSMLQLYCERLRRLEHIIQRSRNAIVEETIAKDPKLARKNGWIGMGGKPHYPRVKPVPLYIMCNETNRSEIEGFMAKKHNFHLRREDVIYFTESDWPMVNKTGKILMQNKRELMKCPMGSGGVFAALGSEGIFAEMKSRGVRSLFVMNGDNLLARVADPIFLGCCQTLHMSAGLKCVERKATDDRLGIFATHASKEYIDADADGDLDMRVRYLPMVLEHYEAHDTIKYRRAENIPGREWHFYSGNMGQYYFTLKAAETAQKLQFEHWHALSVNTRHFSVQKGRVVTPPSHEKNAYRLETLIFDTLPEFRKVIALQADRGSDFAPVRSATDGVTAVSAMGVLHQRWLVSAGARWGHEVVAGLGRDNRCEVSPLVSYAGEGLDGSFFSQARLRLPVHICSTTEHHHEGAFPVGRPQNRSALLKLMPWASNSELPDEAAAREEAKKKEEKDKPVYEPAGLREHLPTTPRKLRDAVHNWQERVKAAYDEVERKRELQRLMANQKKDQHNAELKAEIAKLLDNKKRAEEEQRKKEEEGRNRHGDGSRLKTMPFRPDRDEDDDKVFYGVAKYHKVEEAEEITIPNSPSPTSPKDDSGRRLGASLAKPNLAKIASPKAAPKSVRR